MIGMGHGELKNEEKEVYKLTTENNPLIFEGLISIRDKHDHVFIDLIETAKFNKGKRSYIMGLLVILWHFAVK
ncbi:MAG: hypothetical protein WKG06_45250 [Segetibacter sp.]